jgi:phosphate transport system substrate-binding protein
MILNQNKFIHLRSYKKELNILSKPNLFFQRAKMKIKQTILMLALAFSAVLFITSCGKKEEPVKQVLSGEIKIDGSSTVFPLTEAVAEEFRAAQAKVQTTIGVSGTGGGFKKFGRGETDISNASRMITPEEIEICKQAGIDFVELPIAYDGLAVIVNKENTWVNYLTVSELKKIWAPESQGKITKWNQIRPEFPKEEIHLYGAGTASGTFDYFTEAIVGKAKSCRGDYTASEDDNMLVQGISTDKNSLGFFGLAYYEENKSKLKLVPISMDDTKKGSDAVAPTFETVMNGTYQPLSRPLFIYVKSKSIAKPEVNEFANFYVQNIGKLCKDVGYIPLQEATYKLVAERLTAKKTGTMFSGASHIGVHLDEILQKNK